MTQQSRPVSVRIREHAGAWSIEQAGARFIAPFPLTENKYGTPEYQEATDAHILIFMEEFVERSPKLPPELRDTARRLARETECIPNLLPFHVEHS